jgi:glycosyltransferase involved in cell wall biosynthesis
LTTEGPRPAFADLAADAVSYYFYAEVAGNVIAPSRGLLLTSRRSFDRLGGFDATRFGQSLFELDYALRLRGQGQRCVHVGDAAFTATVPLNDGIDPREWLVFRRAHGTHDPYSNPNFSSREPFALTGDAGLIPATPSEPLRALIAAHNLNNPEGAPRYLSEIVFGLCARGVLDPAVLSPRDGAGASVYRQANVPVRILDAAWTPRFVDARWSPREYEAAQNAILDALRSERPEVVVANTLLTFPVVEAAARLGMPSVWIIHESYSAEVLARLFTPYARQRCEAAFNLATRVIPASHDTAALFHRCDMRRNIRVIHNGIDPSAIDDYCCRVSREHARRELGLDPKKTQIIAVGTVCERKGQHTLVEAAALLATRRRDFVCHLVGVRDGLPYASYVRRLVKRRRIDDCVNLVGETNLVFPWFRAADIFACTSHMEAFSRSVLEAEIFGLPIISTPCHGVGEQVAWNQNALAFPFGDADTLAGHLEALIADAALCREMGAKSRAVFDGHASYDDMLDRYQAVIQQAAGLATGERAAAATLPLRTAA